MLLQIGKQRLCIKEHKHELVKITEVAIKISLVSAVAIPALALAVFIFI